MARRTVEPYSMNSNTANFLFRFTISRVFYLDTLEIRERERERGEERSRAKDLFVKRPKNPLDRKSRKKVSRINQGFLFSLEKYRSDLYPLYCFDRGVYKFPWENFYFEKFFDRCIRCNVAVEKIFFFLFFFTTILIR